MTRTEKMKDESVKRFILRYIQEERVKHPEEFQRRLARREELSSLSESEHREKDDTPNVVEQ